MQENRDGSFEDIKPFSEFMEKMANMEQDDYENVASFHFGTEKELNEIKNRKSFEDRLSALEDEAEGLRKNKSAYFTIPTDEEIKKYASKGPMEKNMLKIMEGISSK